MEKLDGHDLIHDLQSRLQSLHNRVAELELENAKLLSRIVNCRCNKIEDKVIRKNTTAKGDDTGQSSCGFSFISSDNLVEDNRQLSVVGDVLPSILVQESSKNERDENVCQKDGFGNGLHHEKPGQYKKEKSRERMPGCNLRTMHHHAKRYVALKIMYFGQRFYGFASEAQMDPTIESEIFKALAKARLSASDKAEVQYSRCGRTDKGVSSIGQVISLFLRSNLKDTNGNLNCKDIAPKELCDEEIDYVKVLNRVLPKDIQVIGWCPVPIDFHARFSCMSREYKYLFWKGNLDTSAMELAGKKFVGEHDFRNFCKMDAVNVHNYRRKITLFEISSCNKRSSGEEIWAVIIKDAGQALHEHLKREFQTFMLQATIFQEALSSLPIPGGSTLQDGKKKRVHVPLMSRPTEPSYEERRAKLNMNANSRSSMASSPKPSNEVS
ncbi:pseudouridine synthase family protein isoform X2 [Tasmannia lanceolata]|uniref:pseudouridine synthase family protein isoform X2 n=1 Tax=Tasmannia lanceolata TaxID=3420 RepID=UPI0040636347